MFYFTCLYNLKFLYISEINIETNKIKNGVLFLLSLVKSNNAIKNNEIKFKNNLPFTVFKSLFVTKLAKKAILRTTNKIRISFIIYH